MSTPEARASRLDVGTIASPEFDSAVALVKRSDGWYLTFAADPGWASKQKRVLVTTAALGRAKLSGQEFTHPDGSPVSIDTDCFGHPRDRSTLSGAF